jgi:OHCU decarboxylase
LSGALTFELTNEISREEFVRRVGPVFEGSPWVAERASERRPFGDFGELRDALVDEMYQAGEDGRVALIRAHPDIAGKAALAGGLTPESAGEQSSAGLDRLSPKEYREFTRMNNEYRERFGLPMVVCVREHDKDSILRFARERLQNSHEEEIETALGEISKIATLRLRDLIREESPGRSIN